MSFGGFPEFLEVIKRPGLRHHDVDDYIIQIDQYPFACVVTLNSQWLATLLFSTGDDLVCHGFNMTAGGSRGHYKGVGQGILTAHVDDVDVDRLQVFDG